MSFKDDGCLTQNNVSIATSNVSDGNMSFKWGEEAEVLENRERFLGKYGLHPEDCIVMEVEHGENVVCLDSSHRPKHWKDSLKAEAFMTQEKNLVLFLMTADCLPIALYDPTNEVVALAHLGWIPTDKRLLPKVITKMCAHFKSKPGDLLAYIGPGVHKESYLFQPPLKKSTPEWQPFLSTLPSGEISVDLVGYNISQLKESGLQKTNIHAEPTDTAISSQYFSHYRAVRTGEKEGRFATIAWLC